jgi:polyisoprenoid-binding protein YceI
MIMEVNSIKSTEGSTMDNKTYEALKSDKFPQISFLLTEPVLAIPGGANAYSVTAKGTLTIAGVTKIVSMPIKISEDADKKITVEGIQKVKMSDYGIQAPTAIFGVLKTGDVITINFKATFLSN